MIQKLLMKLRGQAAEREHQGWSHSYDVAQLRARLARLPADDELLPLLTGYLDACAAANADTRVSADHAAHQFVGQMNMLANLKRDVEELWASAHSRKD